MDDKPIDGLYHKFRVERVVGGAPLMAGEECRCHAPWPCPEVLDVAEVLGVDPHKGRVT